MVAEGVVAWMEDMAAWMEGVTASAMATVEVERVEGVEMVGEAKWAVVMEVVMVEVMEVVMEGGMWVAVGVE
jgi:hypothetical protein